MRKILLKIIMILRGRIFSVERMVYMDEVYLLESRFYGLDRLAF